MTVRIDPARCDGCAQRAEAFCEEICPGDLLYRTDGRLRLREPDTCWDCFACVKACPREALCVELPTGISPSRHCLCARLTPDHVMWKMHDRQGHLINQCTLPNRIAPAEPLENTNHTPTGNGGHAYAADT